MKKIGKKPKAGDVYRLGPQDISFTVGETWQDGRPAGPAVMRVVSTAFDKPAPADTLGALLNRCAANPTAASVFPAELRQRFGITLDREPEEVLAEWRDIRDVMRSRAKARG